MSYVLRVDVKLTSMKNRAHTCPKTHQKLFLSSFFGVKMGNFFAVFLSSSVFKWPLLISASSCEFLEVLHGFWGSFVTGLHWLEVRKSSPKFFPT